VSRDRALRLNPAFVSFQFPSVLLIYRLVRFSTNSASDHSRLLTPASIAGRARKVWNGATLPSAPVSAKDRNPPDLVVREGDHGCRLRGNSCHWRSHSYRSVRADSGHPGQSPSNGPVRAKGVVPIEPSAAGKRTFLTAPFSAPHFMAIRGPHTQASRPGRRSKPSE
jgi:hypothetical protein